MFKLGFSETKVSAIMRLIKDTPYSFGQDLNDRWYLYDPAAGNIYLDTDEDLDYWIKFLSDYDAYKHSQPISEDGVVHLSLFPDAGWYRKNRFSN